MFSPNALSAGNAGDRWPGNPTTGLFGDILLYQKLDGCLYLAPETDLLNPLLPYLRISLTTLPSLRTFAVVRDT
jgi:hypothetical protein